MKNKYFLNLFTTSVMFFGLFATSCDNEEYLNEAGDYPAGPAISIAAPTNASFQQGFGDSTFVFTITLDKKSQLDTEVFAKVTSGDAVEDTHFEYDHSVVIKAYATTGTIEVRFSHVITEDMPVGATKSFSIEVGMAAANATITSASKTFNVIAAPACLQALSPKDYFTGAFSCNEPGYGDYPVNITLDPEDETIYWNDNFWDFAGAVYYVFGADGSVSIPEQVVEMGGDNYIVLSDPDAPGSFNQCTNTFEVEYYVFNEAGTSLLDNNTHTFSK